MHPFSAPAFPDFPTGNRDLVKKSWKKSQGKQVLLKKMWYLELKGEQWDTETCGLFLSCFYHVRDESGL